MLCDSLRYKEGHEGHDEVFKSFCRFFKAERNKVW